MVLQELDGRHSGHGTFTHRVRISGPKQEKIDMFHRVRTWCWETFGPSTERDTYTSANVTAPWAWHLDSQHYIPYIYLKTNREQMLFTLKWG